MMSAGTRQRDRVQLARSERVPRSLDRVGAAVEYVLHALVTCLTAGLANIAAARKVTLYEIRATVTGDIDLNGLLA